MATDIQIEYGKTLSDSEVVSLAQESYKNSKEWFADIWKEASVLYDMYYGETLSESDKQYLIDTKRPPISFNYAVQTVNAIVGSDQADRKEAVFKGSGPEDIDAFKGEGRTQIVRKFMNECNGRRHESDAFLDDCVTGYGFSEVYLDVSRGKPRPVLVRVQPWEMFPDPDAGEDNLEDARYFCRLKAWYLEEVQARWPDKADDLKTAVEAREIPTIAVSPGVEGSWKRGRSPRKGDRIEVLDFQYKRYMPRVMWKDPESGQMQDTTHEEMEQRRKEIHQQQLSEHDAQMQKMMAASGGMMMEGMMAAAPPPPEPPDFESWAYAGETYWRAYVAMGNARKPGAKGVLLSHKQQSIPKFSYNVVTGYKKKDLETGRVRFFGPMRILHDPQMYINKTAAVYLEILSRMAKGGGFIGESAITGNPQDFIRKMSTPVGWQIVRDEAIERNLIVDRQTVSPPQSFERFMELCVNSLGSLTGVTDWLKGTANTERSNVLISNLQGQSMVLLNPLFDPLQEFRIRNARLMVAVALKYCPEEDLEKILGDVGKAKGITYDEQFNSQTGKTEKVPKVDEMTGMPITAFSVISEDDPLESDVTVDVGQASPTIKQAVWQIFAEQGLFKDFMAAGVPPDLLVPPLVRNLPIPGVMPQMLGDEVEQRMRTQMEMGTQQGILEALANLEPQMMAETLQKAMELAQGIMAQEQGAPPEEAQGEQNPNEQPA